jgi:hypothetical protein
VAKLLHVTILASISNAVNQELTDDLRGAKIFFTLQGSLQELKGSSNGQLSSAAELISTYHRVSIFAEETQSFCFLSF